MSKPQKITQNVNVSVHVQVGRRRWRFPLLGVIAFTIAMFWPMAIWHGVLGGILEAAWLVILGAVWGLVLVLRSLP